MRATLTMVDPATAIQVADFTRRARGVTYGDASISFEVPMRAWEVALWTYPARVYHLIVSRFGVRRVYRVFSPSLTATGVRFEGISLVDALNDDEYAALWSDSGVANWFTATDDRISGTTPDRYAIDFQNRIFITPNKGATIAGSTPAHVAYEVPVGSSREITLIKFVYAANLPSGWTLAVYAHDPSDWNTATVLWQGGSIIGGVNGTVIVALATPTTRLSFNITPPAGPATWADETGDRYFKVTSLRVVTAETGLIDTTLGTAVVAVPGPTVCTPASMANITVGTELFVSTGGNGGELVTVTAVTATTFTATYTTTHPNTSNVWGFVGLYADEVVRDIRDQVRTLNPSTLPSGLRIQTPALDLTDLTFQRQHPLSALQQLAAPIDYVAGIDRVGQFYFIPRGTGARTWAVRAAELEIQRPLDGMVNSVRVLYKTTGGETVATAYATDAASVAALGITRRRTIEANTTSLTEAEAIRDASLATTSQRTIKIRITFRRLLTPDGAEWPGDQIQPGDSLTIINLPGAIAPSRKLRTFTVSEVVFNPLTNQPSVTLEIPLPSIDVLLGLR